MGRLQGLKAPVAARLRSGGERGYLNAPARAGAGGHEEGGALAIGGGDGDALGLVGGAASCRFLRAGGVLVQGVGEVLLQLEDVFAGEGVEQGADVGVWEHG